MTHQEFPVSQLRLPRHLSRALFKLHAVRLSIGLLLLAQGISSIFFYQNNLFVVVICAGLFSSSAGIIGSIAIRKRSLVLHVGAMFVSAISFYISLLAYTPSTATAALTQTREWLVIINAIMLAIDMIFAVLNVGIEIAVIYVGVSHRPVATKDNLQETGDV